MQKQTGFNILCGHQLKIMDYVKHIIVLPSPAAKQVSMASSAIPMFHSSINILFKK